MIDKNKLPEGWEVKKFGEVIGFLTDFQANGSFAGLKENVKYYSEKNYAVLVRLKDLRSELNTESSFVYTDEHGYNFLKKSKVKEGDLLVANVGAGVGTTLFMPKFNKKATLGPNMFRVDLNEIINPKYFKAFCDSLSFWKQLKNVISGSGQPKINKAQYRSIEIPLPPLSEQEEIVVKIEELLSELDQGKQQLETARQQLKVYRQAVLRWAFEGKLTNAIENGQKTQGGELPDGWKWVKIEDIATVGTGATPLKSNKAFYENGKVAWVTSGALNDEFVKEATDFVTEKALRETNLKVYPKHTLLLAMYGEGKTRGKCSELLIEASTNQAIAAIHFEKHDIRVKPFLKYFLLKNYNDIRRMSSGGVQPNLNLGIVKKTPVPFPSLEEQNQIVQEIESRLSVCDKVEETIAQSLQQVETLQQSILKKAFEGKLINQ